MSAGDVIALVALTVALLSGIGGAIWASYIFMDGKFERFRTEIVSKLEKLWNREK